MKVLVVMLLVTMATMEEQEDLSPAAQQLLTFKQKTKGPIGILTTSNGAPVEYKDATNTLNTKLIMNENFMDILTHTVRERIPERVVHAKGGGAFGYFEVTHDISDICKANLFSVVKKKTPIAVRFSLFTAERGGSDTSRDARGFAVKFYTKEGNLDLLGFNSPMAVNKDPLSTLAFMKAMKRNPATNLIDINIMWDFFTLNPETFHSLLLIFGDRGIPDGYRHMPGFPIHTFEVVNENGDIHFMRFHFLPEAGIKNLQSKQASKIAGDDPDYANRDLYNAIGNGKFPVWTIWIQVLTFEEVKTAGFDVFDVTKVLPLNKYPLRQLGRFVLNKNPTNYHAEIEQLAFSPGNLVPGILGAPDKVFEARRLAYRDAQYYRLGANFKKDTSELPLHSKVSTYIRDGRPPLDDNGKDSPNYYPNSFHGPEPFMDSKRIDLIEIYQDNPNNFEQVRELYTNGMTKEERSRTVENIVVYLKEIAYEIQDRALKLFTIIHPDLGKQILQGLHINETTNLSED